MLLTINAGGSSIKTHLFLAEHEPDVSVSMTHLDTPNPRMKICSHGEVTEKPRQSPFNCTPASAILSALTQTLEKQSRDAPSIVAHRFKFAGPGRSACIIDASLRDRLVEEEYVCRLHNPLALDALNEAIKEYPHADQVAVFDNELFSKDWINGVDLPLSARIRSRYELQADGHHGLALESVLDQLSPEPNLRTICVHLGSGVSVSGFLGRRPGYNSMAYSSFDGPLMNSRSGSLSAGLVLKMLGKGASLNVLSSILHNRSGVFALARQEWSERGLVKNIVPKLFSDDVSNIYTAAVSRDFISAFSSIGGCDALVFSGGVARTSGRIVEAIITFLTRLGIEFHNSMPLRMPCIVPSSDSCVILQCDEKEEEVMHRKALSATIPPESEPYLSCISVVPGYSKGVLTCEMELPSGTSHIALVESLSPANAMRCRKASAIISRTGDKLGHGAAVCRELGLPSVICGSETLEEYLGAQVTLHATEGKLCL